MTPQQTFESYPVFGDNATKVAPDNAKYSAGFQQADVLPAEWMNWAWNKNTKGITDLNTGLDSVEKEIINVLDAASQTPALATNNQLLTSINYLISQAETRAKLAAHPVGSLYWSSDSTDPGTLFGGTWARIKDTFVWAAGDSDTINATGGNKTVTIETTNLPAHTHGMDHTHGYTPSGSISSDNSTSDNKTSGMSGNSTGTIYFDNWAVSGTTYQPSGALSRGGYKGSGTTRANTSSGDYYQYNLNVKHTHNAYFKGSDGTTTSISTSTTGDGGFAKTALNIMNPNIVKYCWERTA